MLAVYLLLLLLHPLINWMHFEINERHALESPSISLIATMNGMDIHNKIVPSTTKNCTELECIFLFKDIMKNPDVVEVWLSMMPNDRNFVTPLIYINDIVKYGYFGVTFLCVALLIPIIIYD